MLQTNTDCKHDRNGHNESVNANKEHCTIGFLNELWIAENFKGF